MKESVNDLEQRIRVAALADGRTIPPHGYRREDFVDDSICGDADGEPSAEGFCTTRVQSDLERLEVRETAAVYRLWQSAGA